MRAEPRERPDRPSSDLPAPYRSPWTRLAGDLEAVGADLVLRARELWRRNREGSLWRPSFWPRSLAGGFWPLLLAVVLVVAGLAVGSTRQQRAVPMASPAPAPAPQPEPQPEPSPAPSAITEEAQAEPEAGDLAGSESGLAVEVDQDPVSVPEPVSLPEPEPEPQPEPVPGPEQALKVPFAAHDASGVIVAVVADAATAELQLEVNEGFARLEPRRRRRLADDWAEVAAEQGYERLKVVDGRGRLWARPAAVGEGLVVLGAPVEPEPG